MLSRILGFNRRSFESLSEQEILALAISSEEDDARIYRSYAQGDDFIIGASTSAPGQAVNFTLTVDNTVCAGGIATTTMPVDAIDAEKGRLALGGKPLVVSVLDPAGTMQARVPTPTYDWVVGTGGAAPGRRAVVDTALCLDCHVGSLYQHGGNRGRHRPEGVRDRARAPAAGRGRGGRGCGGSISQSHWRLSAAGR